MIPRHEFALQDVLVASDQLLLILYALARHVEYCNKTGKQPTVRPVDVETVLDLLPKIKSTRLSIQAMLETWPQILEERIAWDRQEEST